MTLTPEEINARLTKLRTERESIVQRANAELAPLEGEARDIAERKSVVIGNANLAVGRIEGELKLLEELAGEPAAQEAPHLAVVPDLKEKVE